MLTLSIATPCHEKWENMTPGEEGAYCKSCCKNVIDFTGMSDKEILFYFQNKNEPVCGKFRNDQLNRPLIEIAPSIFMMEIPFWKKFLAALFIYFSSFITGCAPGNNKDYTSAEVPPVSHTVSEKVSPIIATSPEVVSPVEKTISKKTTITATVPKKFSLKKNSKPVKIDVEESSWKFVTTGFTVPSPSYPSYTSCPPFPDLKIK